MYFLYDIVNSVANKPSTTNKMENAILVFVVFCLQWRSHGQTHACIDLVANSFKILLYKAPNKHDSNTLSINLYFHI